MKKSIGAKTVTYPTPVFVVGTYDSEGKPNVMTAAWGGICCSVPPCIAISLRESTHTYQSILDSKAFTISIPSEDHVKEADYFGIASGKDVDKFQATGLTPVKSEVVNAPYVGEFPFVLECELLQSVKIGLHTQFIGEIKDVKVDEPLIEDGSLIEKIKPLIYSPDNLSYYGVGKRVGKAFSVGRQIK
ncbi:flavin reductase family protein [Methanobacterium sp.]|uniref:flavin reductase family protein n=1 Tax=Methanobacterium sp. TaxID=2164 RepID=UPI0025FEAC17|nr:flavin reductase family protein [Methanobacterium sp.]MBI5459708.1 flavin reductase family protein [Methanobacterium sp.]